MNNKLGLSGWAIRSPFPTLLFFIVITILGITSFLRLPVNANPSIDYPLVNITVIQPGAAPAELETNITQHVENAIAGISGVRNIQSKVREQVSETLIEFQLGTDSEQATNDVRSAINLVRNTLPRDIEEPIIQRIDIEGGSMLHYIVQAPNESSLSLSWFIDDTIIHKLLSLRGVEQATRFGGSDREIRVEVEPLKLATRGIDITYLNQQLQLSNLNAPGGSVDLNGIRQSIRTLGQSKSIDELSKLPITIGENRWLYLGEIAKISDTEKEDQSIAFHNGNETVGFSIWRSRGYSDTEVENNVTAELEKIQKSYPEIKIEKISSTVKYTRDSYSTTMQTLIEGALLTILVVYLFLRNWRATFIAAVALPLSIIPTFIVMDMLNFTLNSVSLLALTLATGILVDDAIVEIENIDRFIHRGKRPYIAALLGADSIALAVVATTFSIIAVFLPVSFIDGIVGLYFKQFGLTVAASVMASLVVARLLTPLMSAYILKPTKLKQDELQSKQSEITNKYLKLLDWSLHHRGLSLCAAVAFFVLSLAILPFLPTSFLPKDNGDISRLTVELPPNYRKADVEDIIKSITNTLQEDKAVAHVLAISDTSNHIAFNITLHTSGLRNKTLSKFEQSMSEKLSNIPDIRTMFTSGYGLRDISIILTSKDYELLTRTADELTTQMKQLPQIYNVQNTAALPKPELLVIPDSEQAARLGVTTYQIANTLRIANMGDTDSASAKFNLFDRQIPIRIQLSNVNRENIETLDQLRVLNASGRPIPLSSVAKFEFSEGKNSITRFNRLRQISVEASLSNVSLGQATSAINNLPLLQNLPTGVQRSEYGESQYMGEMLESFSSSMLVGALVVYAILVLLFKDFLQPITILVTLPLSLGGALVALLLIRASLDLSAIIGLLMLMGIVTKNAILLVDFVIIERENGLSRHDALLKAGSIRVKPIIMTTIAMIAGMVPAALGFGANAEFRVPMAITVIGGLTTSTLLSLVFVPVIYSYIDDIHNWLAPKFNRFTSVTKEDIEEGKLIR